MPMTITLADDLVAKLQKHAVPFVDTPQTVIERALTALENEVSGVPKASKAHSIATYNPASPPNLSYTTPQLARVGGRLLPGGKTYWNPIMFAVIEEAVERGVSVDEICELLTINYAPIEKLDAGYKFIPSAGISVQGQDANTAWKQVYRLASSLGIPVHVEFVWQNTNKASMPNTAGSFDLEGEV